jgi:hypothetical protein
VISIFIFFMVQSVAHIAGASNNFLGLFFNEAKSSLDFA